MYICMYVCVCMCVCMYVRSRHACIYVFMCVMYVCMYVCMYAVVSTKFLICRGVITTVVLNYPSKNRGHDLPVSPYKLSFRLRSFKVRLIKILFQTFSMGHMSLKSTKHKYKLQL